MYANNKQITKPVNVRRYFVETLDHYSISTKLLKLLQIFAFSKYCMYVCVYINIYVCVYVSLMYVFFYLPHEVLSFQGRYGKKY